MAILLLAGMSVSACDSNENRQEGVCYCSFFSGDKSQYDLSNLNREQQVAQCRTHDTNAKNFGGRCELE